MFRHVVLGLLQDGEPRHGYALTKRHRERVGGRVSRGNFYRELQRLVEVGLAESSDRNPDGDPRRAPYRITESGRELFLRWFSDLSSIVVGSSFPDEEISTRLAFIADVPIDRARAMLDQLQDTLWMHAKLLERCRDQAAGTTEGDPRGLAVPALILDRRIRHVATEVAFVSELREAYDAWRGREPCNAAPQAEVSAPSAPRAQSDRRRGRG